MADANEAGSARRARIVIVEDDADVREIEMFLLESEGFECVGVPEGGPAAATVKREDPDVVILDMMLPDKDGNTVLAELSADPATREVPVIVVSGYPSRLGPSPQVKQVIPKPFDVTDLLDAVARETRHHHEAA
jgi:two-component system alkaline phosphatase synthesis response regulator PhoP